MLTESDGRAKCWLAKSILLAKAKVSENNSETSFFRQIVGCWENRYCSVICQRFGWILLRNLVDGGNPDGRANYLMVEGMG